MSEFLSVIKLSAFLCILILEPLWRIQTVFYPRLSGDTAVISHCICRQERKVQREGKREKRERERKDIGRERQREKGMREIDVELHTQRYVGVFSEKAIDV